MNNNKIGDIITILDNQIKRVMGTGEVVEVDFCDGGPGGIVRNLVVLENGSLAIITMLQDSNTRGFMSYMNNSEKHE